MVKLIAPLLSQSASGQIGGTHVHATWKGRHYARALVTPSNPQSAKQLSRRALMKFLSQQWASITGTDQASWATLAATGNFSEFNAYVKYNAKLFTQFDAPTQNSADAKTLAADGSPTPALTAGVAQITVSITPASHTNDWGFMVFRNKGSDVTPGTDNLIAVLAADGTNPVTFVDTNMKSGDQYYYAVIDFTTDGKKGTKGTSANATAN
jgi:hypothetical protein